MQHFPYNTKVLHFKSYSLCFLGKTCCKFLELVTESCDQTLAQEKKINLVHQIIFLVMKSAWKQDYKVL